MKETKRTWWLLQTIKSYWVSLNWGSSTSDSSLSSANKAATTNLLRKSTRRSFKLSSKLTLLCLLLQVLSWTTKVLPFPMALCSTSWKFCSTSLEIRVSMFFALLFMTSLLSTSKSGAQSLKPWRKQEGSKASPRINGRHKAWSRQKTFTISLGKSFRSQKKMCPNNSRKYLISLLKFILRRGS